MTHSSNILYFVAKPIAEQFLSNLLYYLLKYNEEEDVDEIQYSESFSIA